MNETTRETLQKQLQLLSERSKEADNPDTLYRLSQAMVDIANLLSREEGYGFKSTVCTNGIETLCKGTPVSDGSPIECAGSGAR